MFTGVTSWMIGSTKAPPLITTFLPEETGADEGHLLRRASVQPIHEIDAIAMTITARSARG
jgi:hypothetical protein